MALVVVALVRGSRPYEETFVVPGGPEEWLQKCHDALEGAPHLSDVKVSDDPLPGSGTLPAKARRLGTGCRNHASRGVRVDADHGAGHGGADPGHRDKAPRVPNRRTAHSATGPTPTGRTAGTTSEVAEHWIARFAGRDQDITEGVLMRKLLKNRNADDIGEKFQTKVTASALPSDHPSSFSDAVQFVSVSKSYGRRRRRRDVLQGITASFPRGTLTAVMGLSGSGKSTLLQCAAGLDRPSAGSIHIGGIDLTALRRKKLSVLRREHVGFVFQAFNLVPTLSVAENIALPLRLDGRHVDRKLVREVADRVGIADQLRRLPDTLSGGQQQRVAIARALITNPEVIFADEPTAALDPYTTEAVLSLLRRAVDELGQTVVLVTHQPSVAAWADRVLILHRGRLVEVKELPDPTELTNQLRLLGAGEEAAS